MMVQGKCLSNTKNFENKMTHLSSREKLRSASERLRVLAGLEAVRRAGWRRRPLTCFAPGFVIRLITYLRSRHPVRPHLMNY